MNGREYDRKGVHLARPGQGARPGTIVRQMRLKAVREDYILCVTWDGATEGEGEIEVAKSYLLRRTPFDGLERQGITYHYLSNVKRQAVQPGEGSWFELVYPTFVEDDLIYATRDPVGGTDAEAEEKALTWLDLNLDARHWQLTTGIGTIWYASSSPSYVYKLDAEDFTIDNGPVGASGSPEYGIGGDADAIWFCSYSPARVYELDTATLGVDRYDDAPDNQPVGIGGTSAKIWHLSSQLAPTAPLIYELDPTDFGVERSEEWGYNNSHGVGGSETVIWAVDLYGDTDFTTIFKVDPDDFGVIKADEGPYTDGEGIGGDEWIIWHSAKYWNLVMELDPVDFGLVRLAIAENVSQAIGGKFA